MNIRRHALGGFKQLPDDVLLVRTVTVLQAMVNNTAFTTPLPSIADVDTAWRDFQEKLSIARRRGSPYDTAAKNASKLQLAEMLRQLAFYVNRIANGDLQTLLSSGFMLNNHPKAVDVPNAVTNVTLREGRQSGQMRMDFEKQSQVLLYEYRYGLKPEGAEEPHWSAIFMTTSTRNNLLAPLEPFLRYYVQVRSVNGLGKSPWSEPVSYITR